MSHCPTLGRGQCTSQGRVPLLLQLPLFLQLSSVLKMTRTASPATSVEEVPTLTSKRSRLEGKGKEKSNFRASSIWNDAELAVERAHEVITVEDLKIFSGVPSNKVVARHIHRLV